jgi:hypothetical protein
MNIDDNKLLYWCNNKLFVYPNCKINHFITPYNETKNNGELVLTCIDIFVILIFI